MRSVIPSSQLSIYIEVNDKDENILRPILYDRFSQFVSFVYDDKILYSHEKIIIINPRFPQSIKTLLEERYLPVIIIHASCDGYRFLNSRHLEWTGCCRIEKQMCTNVMDTISQKLVHVRKYDGGIYIRDEHDYNHMNFIYWEGLYNDLFRMNSYLWAHLHEKEKKIL